VTRKEPIMNLSTAVQAWTDMALRLSEADLERQWAWGVYDSEGVRFAFFRTYEELRELAGCILAARPPRTRAQNILAHLVAAHADLEAVLLARPSGLWATPPAPDQWPIPTALRHIYSAELIFWAACRFALDRARAGQPPAEMQDSDYDPLLGTEDEFNHRVQLPDAESYRQAMRGLLNTLVTDFAGVSDAELTAVRPHFWDGQMPLEFRLWRFDSHTRQHTIQIEKVLMDLQQPPCEIVRLLRLIYAAWAEVEGARIGAEDVLAEEVSRVAEGIAVRAQEIMAG
jgi:hypothetical protein